jgi:hypothetical protein
MMHDMLKWYTGGFYSYQDTQNSWTIHALWWDIYSHIEGIPCSKLEGKTLAATTKGYWSEEWKATYRVPLPGVGFSVMVRVLLFATTFTTQAIEWRGNILQLKGKKGSKQVVEFIDHHIRHQATRIIYFVSPWCIKRNEHIFWTSGV